MSILSFRNIGVNDFNIEIILYSSQENIKFQASFSHVLSPLLNRYNTVIFKKLKSELAINYIFSKTRLHISIQVIRGYIL